MDFGNALPVSDTVIQSVKANFPEWKDSKREKLQEALVKWKKKGGKRTWRVIHDALCHIHDMKYLADEVKESYDLNSDGKFVLLCLNYELSFSFCKIL